jgi:hypothetical protein
MVIEIEAYIEVINLVLSVLILIFSFRTISKLSGELKTGGKFLMTTVFLFGIHELVGVLEEFKIFVVEDLYFMTELAYIVSFFVAVIFFKRLFDRLSENRGVKK